jgi:hypothetical protein
MLKSEVRLQHMVTAYMITAYCFAMATVYNYCRWLWLMVTTYGYNMIFTTAKYHEPKAT